MGGFDLTLEEVNDAVNMVKEVVSPEANTIFGATIDEKYNERMMVTIVATGFEGSKFENATASAKPSFLQAQNGADRLSQISKPQDQGTFDRSRFNEFVTGKPTAIRSLFEKDFGMSEPRPIQQNVQPQQAPQPTTFDQRNNDMDLWNRLRGTSSNQANEQPTQVIPNQAEIDRKYGITPEPQTSVQTCVCQPAQNQASMGQVPPQNPYAGMNNNSTIQNGSNIRVEDAEIPPFLRRKFNK